jgi:hypothetical protein
MAREPEEDRRKAVGADLVLPAAAAIFTIYYFSSIWNSPREAQIAAFMIGTVLLGLIAILAIRAARDLLTGRARLSFEALYGPSWVLPRRLALLGLTLGYLVGLAYLGFTLTSFLFLFLGMTVLSDSRGDIRRIFHFSIVSAVLSLTGWLVFIVLFDTRFPEGLFERAMAGAFGL